MGKFFQYDRQVDENELCGLEETKNSIVRQINAFNSLKIYGRRNFGKTSLLKNVIGHEWQKKKGHFFVYVDLFTVENDADISVAFSTSFSNALERLPFSTNKIIDFVKSFKNIRPVYQISESGIEISLKTKTKDTIPSYEETIRTIDTLSLERKWSVLLVMDEFQEISHIKGSGERFRRALEGMRCKVAAVIMGSKEHFLQKIFSNPRAPLYNWGNTVEFKEIPFKKYHDYISAKFKKAGVFMELETSTYIQETLLREPECINRFCDFLAEDNFEKGKITRETVDLEFRKFVEIRQSFYASIYSGFSHSERAYLKAIAKMSFVKEPTAKGFLENIKEVSKEGVRKIHDRLYDHSIVIKIGESYCLSDPFLGMYIDRFIGI